MENSKNKYSLPESPSVRVLKEAIDKVDDLQMTNVEADHHRQRSQELKNLRINFESILVKMVAMMMTAMMATDQSLKIVGRRDLDWWLPGPAAQ